MKYFSKNKKWMAYLILLTFLFTSIMPTNLATGDSVVYAATDGTVAGQIEVQPEEQVINGTDGNPEVKIQKTVAAGANENEFKVTLQVKTPENLTEIPSSADAAVVLVIDKSGSMDEKTLDCGLEEHSHHNCRTNCNHYYNNGHNDSCYTCGKIAHSHGNSCYELECTDTSYWHNHSNECYVTRMDAARIAAKAFVQTFSDSKTGENDKRLVSIVEFSSNAASRDLDVNNSSTAKIYWQDVATTSGKDAIDRALAVYSDSYGNGGTNIAGGLQLAANIINHSKSTNGVLEDIDNVTVILLTDGCPTFHIDGDTLPTNALDNITGEEGGGDEAEPEDQSDAIAAANNVKAVSSLKVIALDTGSARYKVNGNWQSLDTATWLQNNIGSTYRANNVSTLVDSFEQINTLILLGTQAWQVADPMAPNIVYTGSMTGGNANDTSKTGDTYVYNAATVSEPEKLLWKLKDSYPDGEEMVGETKWYVYTLEYPIRLDNTASGFSFDTAVATNNPTVLDYFMFSKVVETDTVTADSMKQANFNVPKVEGYAGDVTFKKTDALTGNGLNGAEFTLTLKDCHTSHAGAYTATATYGADGTITFSNVPSGHQYTLKETSAPTGYVLPANEADRSWDVTVAFGDVSIKDGSTAIDTIPNTPETVTVEGTKTWDDNNNQDGLRPDSITVNLLKNGTVIDSQTVNAPILERVFSFDAETWTYKWTDLPKYENGAEIEYTITEEAVAGYTTTIDGYNITNKHVPAKTEVSGTKTWKDANNQDGKRPASITVNLLADGEPVASKTVTANDGWKYNFTGLDKFKDGKEIVYTVAEEAVAGYTPEVKDYNITNTHVPEVTEVTVKKVWDDANNQDGKRPAELKVTLSNGTEVTLNAANNWTATVGNLPVYEAGQKITYTWTEAEVEGYDQDGLSVANGVTTFTNKHVPELTEATVKKVWDDADNQDGKRPESLEVTLSNGTKVTLNEGNNWTATVENLPVYAEGKVIEYTWTEGKLPEGYALTDTSVNGTITTLTNSYEPEVTEATVKKVWDDANNQDGIRPDELKVTLSNGTEVTLNAANNWTATVEDLPVYAEGKVIEYTWTEGKLPEGYTLTDTSVNGTITTLINTHTPELTSVTVKKVWDDANDQDGKRPESLEVTLNNNGTKVTLNEGNNWTATIDKLPKYENGTLIIYTWTEAEVKGYEPAGLSVADGVTTFTNKHVPETTEATVKKVWDDADNQDGKRPESLEVTLSNGTKVTLNEGNKWTATIDNLPKYADGEEIKYTWTEGTLPEGYELTDTSVDGTITTLTNTHVPELTEATVKKVWDDADNQDGKRPESLEVTLSNGTKVTLNEGNNWTATVENLPVYAEGKVIEYTWTEGTLPEGYELTDTSVNGTITTLTNTHVPELTEATVKKVWDDADNQDGKRPESLEVTLSNGTKVTLNEGNNWTATVENLPVYAEGKVIEYTWTEGTLPEGYALTGTSVEGTVTTLTNTHVPELTEATVVKVWDDANNQDGKRPEELEVTLSDGTEVTLSAANNWTATVTNLPKYADGEEIEYTWTEGTLPEGYELTDTSVNGTITTLTNTHEPELTEATVKKVWNDANNQDGIRPASLVVTLSNGQSVTLNAENQWTATVENLPVYANGQEIEYTWTEGTLPEGYVLTGTSVEGTVTTLTNTHVPELTEATVVKVWDDANNQDGKRPAELKVTLSDGTEVTLNAANNWTATVTDLPKYEAGQLIAYAWTEGTLPEGYVLTDTSAEGTVTTLTNSYEPEVTSVTVVKVWDDANNQDGIRPAELNVTLSNGTEVTLNAANNWTATVENLPVYADGEEIEYTWTEGTLPEGYALTDTSVNGTITTLINTHAPELTEVTVKKVWDDANDQDGIRPDELKVTLNNGAEVTLNAANNWTATIDNLPKYENGTLISYIWTEAKVAGYEPAGLSVADGVTTFTNKHVPEITELTVTKVWDDNSNQDGVRPEALEITLSGTDGSTYEATMIGEGDTWTYTFENLPVYYNNGTVIEYSVDEEDLNELGYSKDVDGLTITNSYEPEVTELTVTKVWDDNSNQDGVRPEALEITLSGTDGSTYEATMIGEGDTWTYTFENLPVYYNNGTVIEYSVDEEDLSELGYSKDVDGLTITNSYEPELTSVAGIKTWNDNNDQDGKRPASITINLLADGEVIESKEVNPSILARVLSQETTEWGYEFTNLPKYRDGGVEIVYTITEDAVEGYESKVAGYNVTNSYVPETTEVAGTKVWNDNSDQDGIRPESITVNLLADGTEIDSKVVNGEGNRWSYTFTDLPKYRDHGVEIVYTVTEDAVENYTTEIEGTTITNSYVPETTEVTGTKVWKDNSDQDGIRPENITVNLLADGNVVDSKEVSGKGDSWSYTFTDLPKYRDHGVEIVYTVTEDAVENYTTEIEGTIITNSYIPETTEVAGSKTWNDNNNQDGVRPASITVNLLADGTEIDEATVTAENGWAWSFAELPKYKDGGKEIVYTITEDDVAYYTAEVDGYNITNTHTPATTSIYGEKIWDDNDNAAQARPEYITVELFADGVKVDSTSATAVDWAYAFDNLPVYKNGGETIVYQVVEVAVKDYTTAYTKAVNKNDIQVNIINTYAVEDPEFVTIKGTKVWNDNNNAAGKRPASITVNLFNGGAEPVATTTASLTTDWTYAFTDLPKADENGKAYDYTVTETPVPEYRSVVVETTAGFDIYNSLINGEAGQILVSKLVTGDKAPKDGVYKFVLNINAVKSEWTSLKVYELLQLEKAYEAAVEAYNDAQKAWDEAVAKFKGNARELNTTGSALRFAMAEEVTSPSGYEYLFIDDDARMTSTTSSSYDFDRHAVSDEAADDEIVNPVVEAIYELASEFNRASGEFFEALLTRAEVTTPSALGFMRDDVQDLLDEADRLFEAEALMEATSASVYEFKNSPDVTTASAVTLIITDADGNETRVTTSGAYQFEFELTGVKSLAELENEMFKFRFEAEDGTVITYSIEEVDWVKEGYEGTSIKLNGEVVASGVETDDYVLTTGSVYDFVFINDYEDETGGGYPPPPPYTPPTPPTPPTIPEIPLEDPEVPLDEPPVIEPGEEIEEPEIPLGDAPATGDTNNAVPFMALMLFAMAGLVATRRRFN